MNDLYKPVSLLEQPIQKNNPKKKRMLMRWLYLHPTADNETQNLILRLHIAPEFR